MENQNRARQRGENEFLLSTSQLPIQPPLDFFGFAFSFQMPLSLSFPPTHPGHGVAQRLKEHHTRANPRALEERGGCGAEGGRVVGRRRRRGFLRRDAPNGQRRQHFCCCSSRLQEKRERPLSETNRARKGELQCVSVSQRRRKSRIEARKKKARPRGEKNWKCRKVKLARTTPQKKKTQVCFTKTRSLLQAPLPASLLRCSSVLITSITDLCGLW